jgi:phosphatidate cytidylyltransferase
MKIRAVSALIALILLLGVFWQWRIPGLYGICGVAIVIGTFEYSRLTFARVGTALHLRIAFIIFSLILCYVTLFQTEHAVKAAACISVLYLSMVLFTIRANSELAKVLQYQNFALMGFFYVGIFPGLCLKPLQYENGAVWFLGLLAIVFSGDTFAYLFGRMFGKNALLAPVSPKKTVEGSIGGLLGSALAGIVLDIYFLGGAFPLWQMISIAVVTGGFAQIGDLFESLLKRLAEVKDSGAIMPGHGGVLDRLDGVIFAAPVYFSLTAALLSAV